MLQAPATTGPVSSARGILDAVADGHIVLSIPGTDYRLHLGVYKPPSTPIGKRIAGTIRAQARRIDITRTGGKYIEPIYGRPRRIQGTILEIDTPGRSVTIDACIPFVCKADPRQQTGELKVGDFVACDLTSGSSFTPGS